MSTFTRIQKEMYADFSGVAVGGGWQALVAYINLGCYYIFGLPFGYFLGYALDMGVKVEILSLISTTKSTYTI